MTLRRRLLVADLGSPQFNYELDWFTTFFVNISTSFD